MLVVSVKLINQVSDSEQFCTEADTCKGERSEELNQRKISIRKYHPLHGVGFLLS